MEGVNRRLCGWFVNVEDKGDLVEIWECWWLIKSKCVCFMDMRKLDYFFFGKCFWVDGKLNF